MGNCRSSQSTRVASSSTAKLILPDGKLQEFAYSVKASYVLQRNPATHFICNADEMEFDDVVSAVHEEDELQPGQLYFALPVSWLNHPLQPEEMAALAVKASSALMKHGGGFVVDGEKTKHGGGFVVGDEKLGVSDVGKLSRGGTAGDGRNRRRGDGGGGGDGGRKFAAKLSVIPE
ncbi:hypothetical protein LINPERPRIM_LOCUS39818 [Linum perenne]